MNSGAGYHCIAKAGCFATEYVGEQEYQMCGMSNVRVLAYASEAMRTCQHRRECAAAAEIPSVEARMARMEELYTEVSGRLVVLEKMVTSLHGKVDKGQARVEKDFHYLCSVFRANHARHSRATR